jgi:hypothetical protein
MTYKYFAAHTKFSRRFIMSTSRSISVIAAEILTWRVTQMRKRILLERSTLLRITEGLSDDVLLCASTAAYKSLESAGHALGTMEIYWQEMQEMGPV